MADLTSESTTSQPSQGESSAIPSTMTDNLHTGLRITPSLFNGPNYLAWLQSLTIFLKGKGKMRYVDGWVQALSITDLHYCDQWEITNFLIIGWLIHSMVPEIGECYLSIDIA